MTATLPPKQLRDDHDTGEAQRHPVVVEPPAASTDQNGSDIQGCVVGAGPKHPADQGNFVPHDTNVGGASTPDQSKPASAPIAPAPGRAPTSPATKDSPTPNAGASPGTSDRATGQSQSDTHPRSVGGAPNDQLTQAKPDSAPNAVAPELADPLLALASDVLDDLEKVRIANENRLRQLTRTEEDKDGEERGFGLTLDHPDVARLSALLDLLKDAEKQATNNLTYRMKKHPLGSWVKQTKGVGEKQAARLLATIGDPYWNDLHERPRLVSELWSYCGYGDSSRQVRRKGVKANWSDDAKKRAHLVAEKCKMMLSKPCYSVKGDDGLVSHTVHIDDECTCSRYRVLYDEKKAQYAGSVHNRECNRCTGKGQLPAPVGSPRKAAHIDAMALRAVKKEILRDLWREAKSLHDLPGDHSALGHHPRNVAGVSNSSDVLTMGDNQSSGDVGGT